MRFLLYFPLPLLLILCSSFVVTNSPSINGIGDPTYTNDAFVNSSLVMNNYDAIVEKYRRKQGTRVIKPWSLESEGASEPNITENYNNLSIDELKTKLESEEGNVAKLIKNITDANEELKKEEEEAKVPLQEYEDAKKEWERLDGIYQEKKKPYTELGYKLGNATKNWNDAKTEFERLENMIREREKLDADIEKNKEFKKNVENADSLLAAAKARQSTIDADISNQQTIVDGHDAPIGTANTNFVLAEKGFKGIQALYDKCKTEPKSGCPSDDVLKNAKTNFKNAKNALDQAKEQKRLAEVTVNALKKEKADLPDKIKLYEKYNKNKQVWLNVAQVEETELKEKKNMEEQPLEQTRQKNETAAETFAAATKTKNTAKSNLDAFNKDELNKAETDTMAAFGLFHQREIFRDKLHCELGSMKEHLQQLTKDLEQSNIRVEALKKLYEKKKADAAAAAAKQDPGTGSASIIAGALIGLMAIFAITFFVIMVIMNRRNGRKPLALVFPFRKAGNRAGKGPNSNPPNPSVKLPSDPSVAPQQVSDNKSDQAVPAASNNATPGVKSNEAPLAVTDGQNKQRDGDCEEFTPTGHFALATLNELKNELAQPDLEYINNNMKTKEKQIQLYQDTNVLVFAMAKDLFARMYLNREEGVSTVSSFINVKMAKFYTAVEDMARDAPEWLKTLTTKTFDKPTPFAPATRILAYETDSKYRLSVDEVKKQDEFMKEMTIIRNYAISMGNEIKKDNEERSGAGGSDNVEEDDDRKQTTITVAKKKGSRREKKKNSRRSNSNRKPSGKRKSGKKKKQSESSNLSDSGSGRITHETKVKRIRKSVDPEKKQRFDDLLKKYELSELNYGPHIPECDEVAQKRLDAFQDGRGLRTFDAYELYNLIGILNNCIKRGEKDDNVVTPHFVHSILYEVSRNHFDKKPKLLRLKGVYHVIADLHGNADDLKRIFESFGGIDSLEFKQQKFLFTGDYVDRGKFSLEVILLLFLLKMQYPEKFFLLRGNHESYDVNVSYGFYLELRQRFGVKEGTKLLGHFGCCFQNMPLAAVAGKTLYVHGGISDLLTNLEQIEEIDSFFDPRFDPLSADLLWGDPKLNMKGKGKTTRGVSQPFGRDVIIAVMQQLGIDLIIRAHQKAMNGNEFLLADIGMITLFSASGYEGHYNFGSFLTITDDNLIAITMYGARLKDEDEVKVKARIHDNYAMYTNNLIATPNDQKKAGPKEDASITVDHREEEMKKMGKK